METLLDARGYFWWDNELLIDGKFAPYNNVPGVLKIDHLGQSHIQLHSCLSDKALSRDPHSLRGERPFLQEVHGILYDTDQYVCLKQVRMSDSYISSRGPSYEDMKSEYCLLGNNRNLLKKKHSFRSISLSLDFFRDWLEVRSIIVTATSRSVRVLQKDSFHSSYKCDIGNICLKSFLTRPARGLYSSVLLKETPFFELVNAGGMNISQIELIIRRLEEFLNLLADAEVRLDFPTAKMRGNLDSIKIFYQRPERSTHIFERKRT